MRLPNSEHTDQPWRIHEIAADFHLEDVRALPTPGGPDDFERFVRMGERMAGEDHKRTDGWAWPARALWDLRRQLGRLLGWDRPEHDLGARVSSLRDRLSADLREGRPHRCPTGRRFARSTSPTTRWPGAVQQDRALPLLLRLGPDSSGGYWAQMATLVKPNGLLGRAYMAGSDRFAT
ncbi:DUF2867 domain-containing protein [Streptomyces sp. ISL-98]|uniref:DUF2867 domain-containing protein n=1 Tax=Streptomyces sp. ISL-98 TaxID=2819192 RepID=UPI0020362458|nr:DUF2867 domain-containing protein [Streptomyces sp. ISL-98]